MRRLFWSGRALLQFKSAIDYLAERNPDAAASLETKLTNTAIDLAKRPIGRPGRRGGTYEKVVVGTRYILVYALDDLADTLTVVRLFHMSQNWTGWADAEDDQ